MLIIYAHPKRSGNCGFVLQELESTLPKGSYEVIDLYQEKFNPILSAEELFTSGSKNIADDVKLMQEKITQNDKIVFIYPTWWNNLPAILKGFEDRVFTKDFGFSMKNGMPKGLLKGKAVVITTSGGPSFFQFLMGFRMLKVLTKDTLGFCGLKVKGIQIGTGNELKEKNKPKLKAAVNKAIRFLK